MLNVDHRHRWPYLPAVLVAGLASFAVWHWLGTPVNLPDAPGGRLQCLSYTPYESGQSRPDGPGDASTETIERDLAILSRYAGCIRIYTAMGPGARILEAAQRHGMTVFLGAWIGRDRQRNALEIDAALALAQRHREIIRALVVGNEVLLRRELPPEDLAALIRSVKPRSPVPVAYADVTHFIEVNPVVAGAADLLMIHILPYWDDPRPRAEREMQGQVEETVGIVRRAYPSKSLMIGETGFPSAGRQRGPARPGRVSEARFVRSFAARAATLGVPYNLIEAIDQPWKRLPEGTVGGYWGLLDEQREPKFALRGPVSEWPDWRRAATLSAAIAALALLAGLRRHGLTLRGWLLLGSFAVAFGIALIFQFDFVSKTSQSLLGWCAGAVMAALSAAAVLVVAEIAENRAAGRPPAWRSLSNREFRFTSAGSAALLALACGVPAAYISLTLAFAPRYLDVPIAAFLCPTMALTLRHLASGGTGPRAGECREEAMLAGVLMACALLQLEWRNAETYAWALLCALLALPWLGALRVELRGLRKHLVEPAQPQQGQ
jgi:glucan 1,3-beta-glucosidase